MRLPPRTSGVLPLTENGLQKLKAALEDGRIADALNLYDDAEATIGNQESRERTWQKLSRGVLARTDTSAQANSAARQFTQTVGAADQSRIAFHVGFMSFAGGNLAPDEMAAKAEAVIDSHETVVSRAETMIETASGVSLPPTVGVFGPNDAAVAKGDRVDLSFTAENLGTLSVTDLDSSVEGYDLDASPEIVASLDAGESVEISISGTASEAGTFSVALRLSGESAEDTATVALTVLDREDLLGRTLETLRDLQTTVEALTAERDDGNRRSGPSKGNGNGDGGLSGLENKVETAVKRVEKLRDQSGGGKSTTNRIESVSDLLGAFQNQTEALSGSSVPAQRAAVLHHDAGQAISLLERAADAEA